jgi:uncharacterized surface protein with fasciclin (FAS1) repeats
LRRSRYCLLPLPAWCATSAASAGIHPAYPAWLAHDGGFTGIPRGLRGLSGVTRRARLTSVADLAANPKRQPQRAAIASCRWIASACATFAILLTESRTRSTGVHTDLLSRIRAELASKFLRAIRQGHYLMEQSKNTSANQQGSTTHAAPMKNIVEMAIAAGNFTTLVAGIKAAGLNDTLTGRGPFTVFAPTDEAFKKLPSGAWDALLRDTAKLKAVMSYHVITGHVLAQDFKSGDLMTVQGSPLTAVVSSSDVQVNGAHVRQRDITASNGVIHVIDAVIMPRNWQLLAAAA